MGRNLFDAERSFYAERGVVDCPEQIASDVAHGTELALLITMERRNSQIRIGVAGEVDIATAPQLRRAFADALMARPSMVQVDLSQVAFIDARGVALLAQARVAARRAGAGFVVHNPRPLVRRVLDIVGLTPVLEAGSWSTKPVAAIPLGGAKLPARRYRSASIVTG
jgi:anti-sigma B factor antagonist